MRTVAQAVVRRMLLRTSAGVVTLNSLLQKRSYSLMVDIRVFNALAAQTSMKIGQLSFNVTTPVKEF